MDTPSAPVALVCPSLPRSLSLSCRPLSRAQLVVMTDPADMEAVSSGGGNETILVNATGITNEGPYPSLSPAVRVSLAMAFGKSPVSRVIVGTFTKLFWATSNNGHSLKGAISIPSF